MNDFWARKLGISQPSAPAQVSGGTGKVWWQDEPQQTYQQAPPDRYQQLAPPGMAPAEPAMSQQQEDQLFRQLQQVRDATTLTADQMEFMAEYELKRPKYNQSCPQCGSGNFIPHGTRAGSVTMPTDKCFDCGFSARGPEPALAGRASGKGSVTRQIDTGGAAGSMYMQFRSIPQSYVPRA